MPNPYASCIDDRLWTTIVVQLTMLERARQFRSSKAFLRSIARLVDGLGTQLFHRLRADSPFKYYEGENNDATVSYNIANGCIVVFNLSPKFRICPTPDDDLPPGGGMAQIIMFAALWTLRHGLQLVDKNHSQDAGLASVLCSAVGAVFGEPVTVVEATSINYGTQAYQRVLMALEQAAEQMLAAAAGPDVPVVARVAAGRGSTNAVEAVLAADTGRGARVGSARQDKTGLGRLAEQLSGEVSGLENSRVGGGPVMLVVPVKATAALGCAMAVEVALAQIVKAIHRLRAVPSKVDGAVYGLVDMLLAVTSDIGIRFVDLVCRRYKTSQMFLGCFVEQLNGTRLGLLILSELKRVDTLRCHPMIFNGAIS